MGLYQNRIVIKIGTSTLTNNIGQNNPDFFNQLAYVLSDIQNLGYEIILVSSGATAIGASKLCMNIPPTDLRLKQAAAAVGQCKIMYLYDKFFSRYDKIIAQILLNSEDIENNEKKENLINTFESLIEMGVIPIVNENDSVSYTEIESKEKLFSDNDMLSAIVSILCKAKKLIILSDINGFYNSDPRLHPNAKLIKSVSTIDDKILSLAGGTGSRRGTGGMKAKLKAAKLATEQGIDTIIANGKNISFLHNIIKGEDIGTIFLGNKV